MYQEAIGCATSQKPTNNEATTRMSENTPPHSDEWHVPTQPFVERHQMGGCDTNMWPNEQGAWIVLALHACMLAMAACAMRIASVSVDELTCPSACRGCGTGHIRHAQLPEPKIHIERTAMAVTNLPAQEPRANGTWTRAGSSRRPGTPAAFRWWRDQQSGCLQG